MYCIHGFICARRETNKESARFDGFVSLLFDVLSCHYQMLLVTIFVNPLLLSLNSPPIKDSDWKPDHIIFTGINTTTEYTSTHSRPWKYPYRVMYRVRSLYAPCTRPVQDRNTAQGGYRASRLVGPRSIRPCQGYGLTDCVAGSSWCIIQAYGLERVRIVGAGSMFGSQKVEVFALPRVLTLRACRLTHSGLHHSLQGSWASPCCVRNTRDDKPAFLQWKVWIQIIQRGGRHMMPKSYRGVIPFLFASTAMS